MGITGRAVRRGFLAAFLVTAPAFPVDDPDSGSSTGAVAGVILDGQSGRPIQQAVVSVVGQDDRRVLTDLEGQYRMPLPTGTYQLRIEAQSYLPMVLEGVVVRAREVSRVSSVLSSSANSTTVDVVAKVNADAATAESVLVERKLSEVVSDAVSGPELRAGTASDAAGALAEVPGISVVGNQFVYVRGLGERYSATTLNNALLATTEPEKRVVPLDLFPVQLIDQIRVLKTYSPDLPGEFSGALVQIETVQFPARRTLEIKQKAGFNTRTTGKRWLSSPGGGRDWTGFDDGARSLPSIIPSEKRVLRGNYTTAEMQAFGRAFAPNWDLVQVESARPNQSYSIVAGNTFGKLGVVGALTYANALQTANEVRNFYTPPTLRSPRPVLYAGYNYDSYVNGIRLGGVLNAAYQLTPANRISLKNFLSRDTDDETRFFEGYSEDYGNTIRNTRARWVERQIFSSQLEGKHMIAALGNSTLGWQMSFSGANRDEPDLRESLYRKYDEVSPVFYLTTDAQSAFRMFNYLDDQIYQPHLYVKIPFFRGSVGGLVKTGVSYTHRNRDFSSRRFRFNPVNISGIDTGRSAGEILVPENIRPNGYELREDTRSTDTYKARHEVQAAYGMLDLSFGSKWRVIAGVRVERSRQRVDTFDNFVPELAQVNARLEDTDPLPALNVIYALTPRQNLRFGYSRTVSRPDFRELSPFDFTDLTGGRSVIGNANLGRARIENFDGRWEWFPGADQLLAFSFFYKKFKDPIEQTVQATSNLRTSFANAQQANNYGGEVEFRRNLGFLGPRLRQFSLASNFTFVDSEVALAPAQFLTATSAVRPLAGQSRYIFNMAAEWNRPRWRSNSRLMANSVSRRISDVGTFGLPDIYEERNVYLDFVYTFSPREDGKYQIKFSADNLLDNTVRFTQGGEIFRGFQPGRTYSVGTSIAVF